MTACSVAWIKYVPLPEGKSSTIRWFALKFEFVAWVRVSAALPCVTWLPSNDYTILPVTSSPELAFKFPEIVVVPSDWIFNLPALLVTSLISKWPPSTFIWKSLFALESVKDIIGESFVIVILYQEFYILVQIKFISFNVK